MRLLWFVIEQLVKLSHAPRGLVDDMGETYLAEPDADGGGGAMQRQHLARRPLCADIDGFSLHAAVRVGERCMRRLSAGSRCW